MSSISASLTVKQLNAIHARMHALIEAYDVHDASVTVLNELPTFGTSIVRSPSKALAYKHVAEIFGYHPGMQEALDASEFPTHNGIQEMPETVADLTRLLEDNPIRALIKDAGDSPALLEVGSEAHNYEIAAKIYDDVAKQMLAELPQLLSDRKQVQER